MSDPACGLDPTYRASHGAHVGRLKRETTESRIHHTVATEGRGRGADEFVSSITLREAPNMMEIFRISSN